MSVNNAQKSARFNLTEGTVWAVDKPLGWTSFQVVKKLRSALLARVRHAGVRKLKVGHAGTLDPLASGVMLICVGRATKNIDILQSGVKEYEATLQLGSTTPSFDLETPVDATFPTEHITEALIESVLPQFVGTISQIPPVYSACKVDGMRAYEAVRQGIEVELKPKTLVIDSIFMEAFDPEKMQLSLRIVCSKGTYIRALARDIGTALGSGAHLIALRRTRVGDFRIADCMDIESAMHSLFGAEIEVPQPDGKESVIIPSASYLPSTRKDKPRNIVSLSGTAEG